MVMHVQSKTLHWNVAETRTFLEHQACLVAAKELMQLLKHTAIHLRKQLTSTFLRQCGSVCYVQSCHRSLLLLRVSQRQIARNYGAFHNGFSGTMSAGHFVYLSKSILRSVLIKCLYTLAAPMQHAHPGEAWHGI